MKSAILFLSLLLCSVCAFGQSYPTPTYHTVTITNGPGSSGTGTVSVSSTGQILLNGNAPVSGTSIQYAATSGSAALSGSAAQSGTANALSASATVAGTQVTGTVGNAGTSGTANGISAPVGTIKVDDGDSITVTPNGAGVTSWAALLNTMSFFKNATDYNTAVGGSLITSGSTAASGSPETVTANWSGATTSIHIVSGSPSTPGGYPIAGAMAVTGTNIPFGTTGTLSMSGTLLTLSQSTTGGSSGNVTIRLGGNNGLDRWASQVYPHRPSAYGGSGGIGPVYDLIMFGANDLHSSVSGTSILAGLISLTGSDESVGITPIVSTILPDIGQDWWNYAQEAQRVIVNNAILSGSITGAKIVDSAETLSGNAAFFDGNGVHPLAAGNQILANYWNAKLQTGATDVLGVRQYVDIPPIFVQGMYNQSTWMQFGQSTFGTGGGLLETSTTGALRLQSPASLNAEMLFFKDNAQGALYSFQTLGGNFVTNESGVANRLTLQKTTGNFGIGTIPAFKLDVAGAAQISGSLTLTNGILYLATGTQQEVIQIKDTAFSHTWTVQPLNGNEVWNESGVANRLFLQSGTGFFGVGVNPSYMLDVAGAARVSGSETITGNEAVGGNLTVTGTISGLGVPKSLIRVAGALSSGVATVSNASISGSNCWVVDNSSSAVNVFPLSVTTSGTTATVTSSSITDASPFSLFIAP